MVYYIVNIHKLRFQDIWRVLLKLHEKRRESKFPLIVLLLMLKLFLLGMSFHELT